MIRDSAGAAHACCSTETQPSQAPAEPKAPRIRSLSCNLFARSAKPLGCADPGRASTAEQIIPATCCRACSPWSGPALTRRATWPEFCPAGRRWASTIPPSAMHTHQPRGLPAAQARATWGARLDTGCSVWLFLRRISAARSATITTAAPVWPPAAHHIIEAPSLVCRVQASIAGRSGKAHLMNMNSIPPPAATAPFMCLLLRGFQAAPCCSSTAASEWPDLPISTSSIQHRNLQVFLLVHAPPCMAQATTISMYFSWSH